MATKLLLETIAAQPTARRPLWIMRQAGRYLPEYRALREKHGFKELAESPELATEVNHLLDGFDGALRQIQSLHDALARGDLAFRLDVPDWQGVFASVRDNANTTIERLAALVEQLREAARSVASGSKVSEHQSTKLIAAR